MMHREHIPREITPGKVGSEEASTLEVILIKLILFCLQGNEVDIL